MYVCLCYNYTDFFAVQYRLIGAVMKLTTLKVVLLSTVAVMVLAPVRGAFAANITITADPITSTFTKTGLNGYFYSVETNGAGTNTITSDANANTWTGGHANNGTFTATQATLDTGGGYGTTAGSNDKAKESTFLGADDSTFTGSATVIQGTNILVIDGYIYVTGTGEPTVAFTEISNDGSFLTIGGVTVVNVGDSASSTPTTTNDTLTFENGPGIYAIDLTYWNNAYDGGAAGGNNGTGNELGLTLTGNGGSVVTFGSAYVPAAPEPSTWVALMVGGLMMGALVMRRRKMGVRAVRVAN